MNNTETLFGATLLLRRAFLMLIGGSVVTATWDAIAAVRRLPFRVIDAMPTFWKFWDTTIDESLDKRVDGFFNTVVAAYPDLFHHGLIASGALTDLGSVPDVQARVAKYHVSQRMNPGTTADQVLVMPDRLSELALPHLPDLARRLLDHADSTNPNDYSNLFSTIQAPPGIPARSGYFAGYRVAEKLAVSRSLVELVHLRGPELKRAVLGVLNEFQKAG